MITNQPEIHVASKGWGFEKWIVNNDKYCGKLLYIIKGKKTSLHYHRIKDETFYVHSGKATVYFTDDLVMLNQQHKVLGDLGIYNALEKIVLKPGDNFYIPTGRIHQIIGTEDTELYEFSTKHEDSDSHRIIKGD